MKNILFFCLAIIVLGGCRTVSSSRPVGERPWNIESEQNEWQGVWKTDDGGLLFVEVINGSKGLLSIGNLEYDKDADSLKYVAKDVYLRVGSNWRYASVQLQPDKGSATYLWSRVQKRESLVILWYPDAYKFADLVRDGTLPGSVSNSGDVHLEDLTSNHFEIIEAQRKDSLFGTDPNILFKLSDWKPPLRPLKTEPLQ